jgi:hypothetical protein
MGEYVLTPVRSARKAFSSFLAPELPFFQKNILATPLSAAYHFRDSIQTTKGSNVPAFP